MIFSLNESETRGNWNFYLIHLSKFFKKNFKISTVNRLLALSSGPSLSMSFCEIRYKLVKTFIKPTNQKSREILIRVLHGAKC